MSARKESAFRLLEEIQRCAQSAGDLDSEAMFKVLVTCAVNIARCNVGRDEFVRLCKEGWDMQAEAAAE